MAAMLGTVLADNLLVMYLFWEWTSLLSFLLIAFENFRPEARQAALQSLLVTVAGGLAMFAGILLLGSELGTYSISGIAGRADDIADLQNGWLIAGLFLAGAFTKSAQAPFHFWLPRAMAAPTPASAYLHSATMVKLGIYLLARLNQPFSDLPGYGTVLIAVGMTTMLVAALNALRETQYKAVLAHSTVASLGILVFLLGLPGDAALGAMLSFLLAHALYKAALFFSAGTAIKAAGDSVLRNLGGLRKQLPLTATAAFIAALSMAGLPPLFGFTAKELVLGGLLSLEPRNLLLLSGMLLTSAVLVAIAWHTGVRPFLIGRPSGAKAVESPGLALGPLVLGATGLLLALWPAAFGAPLLESASFALGGSTGPDLALWHGFTQVLGLSALAVAAGALLAFSWPYLEPWRRRALYPVAEMGYNLVFDGVMTLARWTTRKLQNGDQRSYTAMVVGSVVLGGLFLVWRSGSGLLLPSFGSDFSLTQLLVLVLMCAGAIAATVMRGLVATLVSVGIVGFGSAVVYLLNGAPDLALTQFAVEALILVVLLALLLRLPLRPARTRNRAERRLDAVLATAFGAVIFVGLAGMLGAEPGTRLSDYYSTASVPEAHGHNVVNVILVDFRALDTLGEVTVIGFAALIIWALLRRRAGRAA